MKKRILSIILIIMTLFSISGCSKSSKQKENNTPVEFSDFLVERCVRKKLGKEWDEDITVKDVESITSLTISSVYDPTFMGDEYYGYIDLSDLKHFTNLKELKLKTFGKHDSIVNFDTITACKSLEKLYMPWADFTYGDETRATISPQGYKYWRNIISELPKLKYLDLGTYFDAHMRDVILSEIGERNIEIYYGGVDNFKVPVTADENIDVRAHLYQVKSVWESGSVDDIYVSEGNDIDNYKIAWENLFETYSKSWLTDDEYWEYSSFPVIYADSMNDLELQLSEVNKDIEDMIVVIQNIEYFDFSVFEEFKSLVTLTVHVDMLTSPVAANLDTLSELENLQVVSLGGLKGDLSDISKIPNLRELSIDLTEINSIEFIEELNTVRELMISYWTNKKDDEFPISINDKVTKLNKLKYIRDNTHVYTYNEDAYKNIENMESLETLITRGYINVKNITQSSSIKNLYFVARDAYDWSDVTFSKMHNLEQIIMHGTILDVNYDDILELPNIMIIVYPGFDNSIKKFKSELTEKITSNKNITFFGPVYYIDGMYYSDEFIKKLYEAGIDDGVCQRWIKSQWKYGIEYSIDDFIEKYD